MGTGTIENAIYTILFIIVLFQLYASAVPDAQDAGDDLNEAGLPLGNLFVGDGLVFLILMVGLLILIVRKVMGKGGSK